VRIFGLNITRERKDARFIRASDDGTSPIGRSRPIIFPGVMPREADNNSIVMACVFWAMRNVKAAPFIVTKETPDGPKIVPAHPAALMLRSPQKNIRKEDRSRLTGGLLKSCIAYSMMLDGNAYALKVRNGNRSTSAVIGLDWIPHQFCEPVPMPQNVAIVSHYMVYGQRVEKEDIIHHQIGIDPQNQCKGISPLKSVMRQVMTDNDIAIYSQAILNAPAPSMVVTPKGDSMPTQQEADAIADAIKSSTAGERAGSVAVPTFEADIHNYGFSPEQMAIETLNKIPEERITAVFGIPAIVAGMGAGLERSTFANFKEAREAAFEEFMLPLWTDIGETFTDQFLKDFSKNEGEEICFDTSVVRALQEDEDASHKRAREDFAGNIISQAEARLMIGRQPEVGQENVYGWMLRTPQQPPGLPQGPQDAQNTRKTAEGV